MTMPARFAHLLNTKWTSSVALQGWRQFQVVSAQRGSRGWEIELASGVEPRTRAWVSATVLADRARFSQGWAAPTETQVLPPEKAPTVPSEKAPAVGSEPARAGRPRD